MEKYEEDILSVGNKLIGLTKGFSVVPGKEFCALNEKCRDAACCKCVVLTCVDEFYKVSGLIKKGDTNE